MNTFTDPVSVAPTVDAWADRIRPHLARTVEGIIAAGRDLVEAKAALPHGQFGPLLAELGMSRQHAARFMAVAQHPILANVSPGRHLPPSVTVLDELTRVPADELADALERGDIGPSTTRREAAALARTHAAPEPAPTPEPGDEQRLAPGELETIDDTLHEEHGDDLEPEHVAQALDENLESKHVPRPTPRPPALPAPAPPAANPEPEQKPEWQPNKPDLGDGISHPARYSPELIPLFADLLAAYSVPGARILDPFAGPGGVHALVAHGYDTVGIELEEEWAALHERTQRGSALDLPFSADSFDAIVTSPTYGNRLADSHNASDPESRRSYTHDLGRPLHEDNSGTLHWRTSPAGSAAAGSADYRLFHKKAWDEAVLVLRPGGLFILNFCDHVRSGVVQPAAAWHTWCLGRLGLDYIESRSVPTRKLRQGENGNLREQEQVHVFGKPS